MNQNKIQIEPSWKQRLRGEFEQDYMTHLQSFLENELDQKKVIYPPMPLCFEAFNRTPFEKVRVVILGQDPYHGPGQAHGLSFSVQDGVKIPPSLKNIFKELKSDLNLDPPESGDLSLWADQGVLLLNSTLTVEQGKAGSHQKKGWEEFTDSVLKKLNEREKPLAFILWGSFAQKKGGFINEEKHLVIKSPHPSPLSSYRGFFGSKPFSQINTFLEKNNLPKINWA